MGILRLELIYSRLFLSCRLFVVITFSTGLVGVEVTSVSIDNYDRKYPCGGDFVEKIQQIEDHRVNNTLT